MANKDRDRSARQGETEYLGESESGPATGQVRRENGKERGSRELARVMDDGRQQAHLGQEVGLSYIPKVHMPATRPCFSSTLPREPTQLEGAWPLVLQGHVWG